MRKLRGITVGGMLGFNFILNVHIYPTLLSYQSATEAGRYVLEKNISHLLFTDNSNYNSLGFAARRLIPIIDITKVSSMHRPKE